MNEESSSECIEPAFIPAVLSQHHLEAIFNATLDVVFVLDGDSQAILFVNETANRMLGYGTTDLLGCPFSKVLPEGSAELLDEAELVDGVYGPVAFRRADGGTVHADVTAAVIPWDGRPALLYSLRDVTQRTRMEKERARLIGELREALAAVRQLSGLLPICANCKRIRDDQGYWETVERYISARSDAEFSHGICPTCREELYPELSDRIREGNGPG